MPNHITVTEWIRLNDDGSSDHMKVAGDQLIDSFHMGQAPFMDIRNWPPVPAGETCDWIVEVKKVPEKNFV